MNDTTYDITENDLNPRFLFSCIWKEEEGNDLHSHNCIELIIILQGKGSILIEGKKKDVKEGQLIILNPGVEHRSISEGSSDPPLVECCLGFTDVEFKNCKKNQLPLFRGEEAVLSLPEEQKQKIFTLCGDIYYETCHCEAGRSMMLKACLIQLLCMIERLRRQEEAMERSIPSNRYEFKSMSRKYIVENIMKYMEENYQEKISLDQIADNMYLSTYYISKLFKKETGDTPINYLIRLRMKKAREILEEDPSCTIRSVAEAVGYEDAYHFSKLFKKYYGISPLYYRAGLGR